MGKARDLGPRLTRVQSLVPVRDTSTNSIFQGCPAHRPVEEPRAEAQPTDQAEVESVNSSEAKTEQSEGEMVTKRTITIDRILLGTGPIT